jgi:hypothetical protein
LHELAKDDIHADFRWLLENFIEFNRIPSFKILLNNPIDIIEKLFFAEKLYLKVVPKLILMLIDLGIILNCIPLELIEDFESLRNDLNPCDVDAALVGHAVNRLRILRVDEGQLVVV